MVSQLLIHFSNTMQGQCNPIKIKSSCSPMPTSHPNTYQAWSLHLTSSTRLLKHCSTVHEATLHMCAVLHLLSVKIFWSTELTFLITHSTENLSFEGFTTNCLKEDQQQLIYTQKYLKDDIHSKIMFSIQQFLVIFPSPFSSLCRLIPSSSEFLFCQN